MKKIGLFAAAALLALTAAAGLQAQTPASTPGAVTMPPGVIDRQSHPAIRTLSEQEVVDLMVGTAIQGTRNSNTDQLIERARALLAQGRQFQMIPADAVPSHWSVVMAGGGIGGGGAWEHVIERTRRQNLPTIDNANLSAMAALSRHLDRSFSAVIQNEPTGATLNAFITASAVGLPVVDACPAGRAKPEVQQSIPFVNGIPVTPAALVTRWGDTIVVDRAVDDYRYEDIARSIAVASGGGVSNARSVLSGDDIRRATIPGVLSEAILFGRTVREAAARGEDPIAALKQVADGYELFRGVVSKADERGERGFTWWDVELTGTGPFAGHTYTIWVKNENMVTWFDGRPDAAAPDYIYNLDPRTGRAMASGGLGGYVVGDEVYMMGRAAAAAWRTPRGIEVIGPRHFGFDFDYRTIEDVMRTRPALRG